MLGGSSEPAYYLTITALGSEIAATKNKRAAHLIQDFMSETLQIPASRGILKFEPAAEENLATNGTTLLQEIEKLEQTTNEEKGFMRSMSRQTYRTRRKSNNASGSDCCRLTSPQPSPFRPNHVARTTTQASEDSKRLTLTALGKKKLKNRRSILAFFGMSRTE